MPDAFATLVQNIARAIERLPIEFDSHQLILVLAQENQREYINALQESSSTTPFQAVHSAIGKSLARHSPELGIQEIGAEANYSSPNIFGFSSPCSRWAKLD